MAIDRNRLMKCATTDANDNSLNIATNNLIIFFRVCTQPSQERGENGVEREIEREPNELSATSRL